MLYVTRRTYPGEGDPSLPGCPPPHEEGGTVSDDQPLKIRRRHLRGGGGEGEGRIASRQPNLHRQ